MADLDWAEMEGLFCQQAPPIVPANSTCSNNSVNGAEADKRRREPTEVSVLYKLERLSYQRYSNIDRSILSEL